MAKSLIIMYERPDSATEGHQKLSYALYEPQVNELLLLLRPVPLPFEFQRWSRSLERMHHPSSRMRAQRAVRNLFNMLRDAFSQAIAVLVGSYRERKRFGKIAGADTQATQVGQKLLMIVPNSYEQILETYLYHDVA